MFTNYHDQAQQRQLKPKNGNFSNRNLTGERNSAQVAHYGLGSGVVGSSMSSGLPPTQPNRTVIGTMPNSNGFQPSGGQGGQNLLMMAGSNIQVQQKPVVQLRRGPNPLIPSTKQAPLYDPSHRFSTDNGRKQGQARTAQNSSMRNMSAQKNRPQSKESRRNITINNISDVMPENRFTITGSSGLNVGGTALRRDPSAQKTTTNYSSHYRRLDSASAKDAAVGVVTGQQVNSIQKPPLSHFPQMNLQRPMPSDSRPSNASMTSTQESLKRGALNSATSASGGAVTQSQLGHHWNNAEKIELDPNSEYLPTQIERSTQRKGFQHMSQEATTASDLEPSQPNEKVTPVRRDPIKPASTIVRRNNFSNLPQNKRPEYQRDEDDFLDDDTLFFPHSSQSARRPQDSKANAAKKKKAVKQQNFFAAWDDADAVGIDETTKEVLAEEETFDLLAQRGYETLPEYNDASKSASKMQEYERQQRGYEFNFENYIRRYREEEELGLVGKDGLAVVGNAHERLKRERNSDNDDGDSDDNESEGDESCDEEEAKADESKKVVKKKKAASTAFRVNTSYCRSELELLQHVIYKNNLKEVSTGGNLYWFALALNQKDYKKVAKNKFYWNRYPSIEYLARKKVFCAITNRMRKTFEKQFGFSPISFQLPEEAVSLEKYMVAHPKFTFICKPNSGKGGEGIFLIEKFKDIPQNLWNGSHADLLVQRYIKTPILVDKKKFDLRLYVLIKSFDPVEAYLCDEGLARFATEDYRVPTAGNLKNMFMHLTNFSLNKQSEKYVAPEEDFLEDGHDQGSKRLLSSLWKTLEEEGHNVSEIQEKIKDTVRKGVITLEPYLKHYYRTHITKDEKTMANSKVFHILGLDVLIDKKNHAWLMEINSNPSLNIFLEREIPGALNGQTERVLQELDKHVKAKVVTEAIRIVTGECDDEYAGSFEQLLPVTDGSLDSYYVWNKAQRLYELMASTSQTKKDPDQRDKVSQFQFSRFHKVPEFGKTGSYFKADLELVFKNLQKKYDCVCLDIYGFFDACELLAQKIYKEQVNEDGQSLYGENIEAFLDASIDFFEAFVAQQQEEQEAMTALAERGAARKK